MKVFVWILFILIVGGLASLLVFEVISLVKAFRKRKATKNDETNKKRKE